MDAKPLHVGRVTSNECRSTKPRSVFESERHSNASVPSGMSQLVAAEADCAANATRHVTAFIKPRPPAALQIMQWPGAPLVSCNAWRAPTAHNHASTQSAVSPLVLPPGRKQALLAALFEAPEKLQVRGFLGRPCAEPFDRQCIELPLVRLDALAHAFHQPLHLILAA